MNATDPSFEDYVALARAGYDAFNNGEFDAVLELLDPDVSWRRRPIHPVQGEYRGPSDVAENVLAPIQDQFEEMTLEPVEFRDCGANIIVRIRQRARGRSSGATVEGDLVHVLTVGHGRLLALRAFSTIDEALLAIESQ